MSVHRDPCLPARLTRVKGDQTSQVLGMRVRRKREHSGAGHAEAEASNMPLEGSGELAGKEAGEIALGLEARS